MKLKKINAVLTLLIIAFAIDHMSAMAFTLFGKKPFNETPNPLAMAFLVLMCVHALISLIIFFFSHSEAGRLYPNKNKQTIEQRISALIILWCVHFHLSNRLIYPLGGTVQLFITELITLLAVSAHIGTSSHRALITLGIEKKWLVITLKVIMIIIEAADFAGLIYYNFIM